MTGILDLPLETLNHIFDYLVSAADPKKERDWRYDKVRQPLNRLAFVSRCFRDLVESYCAHRLAQLEARAKTSLPLSHCRKPRTYRKHFLRRVIYHCEFCQVKTGCRAIVFNNLVCCRSCDRSIWPEKMTLTAAKSTYDLNDFQLKGIQSGYYAVYGMLTRMFLTSDVKKLAESIHGDLEEWTKKKEEKRLKRQKKARKEEKSRNEFAESEYIAYDD
ncbi:hypothetical protein BZA77DRAFT_18361 [Pyronema omphalodes]|nr:hypothetical protein BZA77DRAFT_18361 [Pyronema omphalodes]